MSFLVEFGLRGEALGGLFDAQGQLYLVFDTDGTKQTTRRRSLVEDEWHPPARRRRQQATAPGYLGRKRGERVRNRLVVQQAHTSEWLGTFGQPGNGAHRSLWAQIREVICIYLKGRGLQSHQGIARLDGEFGHAWELAELARGQLGYLVRCVDYHLLSAPQVQAVLSSGQAFEYKSPDSPLVRQAFDVPEVLWGCTSRKVQVVTRLVVVRSRTNRPSIGVGKRDGQWVYELFATSLSPQAFHCTQIIDLYLGRGAFEAVLGQEDRESGIDRWASDHGPGQEIYQLVAQWVWNLRLWLGMAMEPGAVRRMSLAREVKPLAVEPVVLTEVAPSVAVRDLDPTQQRLSPSHRACSPPPTMEGTFTPSTQKDPQAAAWEAAPGLSKSRPESELPPPAGQVLAARRFTAAHFQRRSDGTVWCPAGQRLHLTERRRTKAGLRLRYEAPARACRDCSLGPQCRGEPAQPHGHGRRIALPAEPMEPPAWETSPSAGAIGTAGQSSEAASHGPIDDKTLPGAPTPLGKARMSSSMLPTPQTSMWVGPGTGEVASRVAPMAVLSRRRWPMRQVAWVPTVAAETRGKEMADATRLGTASAQTAPPATAAQCIPTSSRQMNEPALPSGPQAVSAIGPVVPASLRQPSGMKLPEGLGRQEQGVDRCSPQTGVPRWQDVPASRLRRCLSEHFKSQRVEHQRLRVDPVETAGSFNLESRDERAHRRLTWVDRYQRNALIGVHVTLRVYGMPPSLAQALDIRLEC